MKNMYTKAVVIVLMLVGLVLINNTPVKEGVRSFCVETSRSVISVTNFVCFNFANGMYKLADIAQVYRDRERLQVRVADLEYKLIRYDEMKRENARLRELLEFQQEREYAGVSAQIIGRDMSAYSDFIIINRGVADGVDQGTVLISHDGLVGHVVSAGAHHARAMVITDRKARACAMTQESRQAGIVEGTTTDLLKLRHLDITGTVAIGETVITSGFGDVFPKGLPIGTVTMVSTDSNNVGLYALVRPFVDISKLEEVLCLQNE